MPECEFCAACLHLMGLRAHGTGAIYWKGPDVNRRNALNLGVRYAALLAIANFAWQAIIWFSGLNHYQAALYPFFLFPPVAMLLAFRDAWARFETVRWPVAAIIVLTIALIASLLLIPTMWLFLDVIGHGALPPVLQAQLDALRQNHGRGEDVARKIAQLEQLTPLRFAVAAAINTFVLAIAAAGPAVFLARLLRRPS